MEAFYVGFGSGAASPLMAEIQGEFGGAWRSMLIRAIGGGGGALMSAGMSRLRRPVARIANCYYLIGIAEHCSADQTTLSLTGL